jgi:hypothetical protein
MRMSINVLAIARDVQEIVELSGVDALMYVAVAVASKIVIAAGNIHQCQHLQIIVIV